MQACTFTADKSANVSVDGTGLILTAAAGAAVIGARATHGILSTSLTHRTGFIFEATIDAMDATNKNISVGVANSSAVLTTLAGNQTNTSGYRVFDHLMERENSGTDLVPTFAQAAVGDVLGVVLFLQQGQTQAWCSIYKNGIEISSLSGSMVAGTYYPFITLFDTGDQVTCNFGATPFTYGHLYSDNRRTPWAADPRPNALATTKPKFNQRSIGHIGL